MMFIGKYTDSERYRIEEELNKIRKQFLKENNAVIEFWSIEKVKYK